MQGETRKKLRKWVEALEKLDKTTKEKEAEAWCLSALSILEEDKDFQTCCKERGINAKTNLWNVRSR